MVASKTLSDHITFTNIHMPLVRTPMIVPSQRLNPVPPISPERAAAMVVRGLVDKPARIDTPMGTLAEVGNYFTPRLSRRILHQLYLGYPDSAAARGLPRPIRVRLRQHAVSRSVRSEPSPAASGHPDRSSGGAIGARSALVNPGIVARGAARFLSTSTPVSMTRWR